MKNLSNKLKIRITCKLGFFKNKVQPTPTDAYMKSFIDALYKTQSYDSLNHNFNKKTK
jgi:hypothetical protein